jgi:alpha-tubulin suppressor-like RCC1 family protein
MKRFVVGLTVWAMGLAWVLTSAVLPAGPASALLPTALPGVPAAMPAAPVAVTPPGGFTSLAPSRLLDTTHGVGADQAEVPAFGTVHLQVSGRGGVPASGVSAVVLNVTVKAPTKAGFLSVYRDGDELPPTSNLNFVAGQTVPNLVIVAVGSNGKVALYNSSSRSVELVADVSGYYLADGPSVAGTFGSLAPSRLLDTRIGLGAATAKVAPGGTMHLQVSGRGGVPASGVSAVVLNVTVTEPAMAGFLSVYRDGDARSGTPNLNFVAHQTVPNLVLAPVGANGKVDLYNGSRGAVHLVADVSGYFRSGDPTLAGAFGSLSPFRLLNTGSGVGAPRGAVPAGGTVHLQVNGGGGVPPTGVAAVVLNVTVKAPIGSGFLSVYGDGDAVPGTPNLNFVAARTTQNLVIAPVGANGKVDLFNSSGSSIQLVADVSGYYLATITAATISTGYSHSCAVSTVGGVKCWGLSTLSDGSTTSSSVPADIVGLGAGVTAVSAGLGYSCAVAAAGALRCWGNNVYGQLGNGSTTSSAVPVGVAGLGAGVTGISAGWSHSCAVTLAGAVKCWGHNAFGELGDGTTSDSAVPVGVVGLGSGVIAVSVGEFHSCAVTRTGGVKCWGYNSDGELGHGTTTHSSVPVDVVGLGSAGVAVSAGAYHSCAVTASGAVSCWGRNPNGELGHGTTTDSSVPVGVVGLGSGALGVSASRSLSCAVTSAGAVKCWGHGELGTGATTQSLVPVDVVGLGAGAVAVSAGGNHSCARTSAGAVRCWGDNSKGELGVAATAGSAVPVVVALG